MLTSARVYVSSFTNSCLGFCPARTGDVNFPTEAVLFRSVLVPTYGGQLSGRVGRDSPGPFRSTIPTGIYALPEIELSARYFTSVDLTMGRGGTTGTHP